MKTTKMAPRTRLAALLWLVGLALFMCSLLLPWRLWSQDIVYTGWDLSILGVKVPATVTTVATLSFLLAVLFAAVVPAIAVATGKDTVLLGKRVGFGGALLLGGGFVLFWMYWIWQLTFGMVGSGGYAAIASGATLIVGGLTEKGLFGLAGDGVTPEKRAGRRMFGLAAPKTDEDKLKEMRRDIERGRERLAAVERELTAERRKTEAGVVAKVPERRAIAEEAPKKKEKTGTCPKCGAGFKPTARYCPRCGHRLKRGEK